MSTLELFNGYGDAFLGYITLSSKQHVRTIILSQRRRKRDVLTNGQIVSTMTSILISTILAANFGVNELQVFNRNSLCGLYSTHAAGRC